MEWSEPTPDALRELRTLRGVRVLVIEDEFILALYVEEQLQEAGCVVIGPAGRIASGLSLVATEHPDVAVLDLNLGGETTTPIAAALAARGIPFLIVSGYGDRPLSDPVLHAAPRLGKPFRTEELLRKLADVVETSSRAA